MITYCHFPTNQFRIFLNVCKGSYRDTPVGYWSPKVGTKETIENLVDILQQFSFICANINNPNKCHRLIQNDTLKEDM